VLLDRSPPALDAIQLAPRHAGSGVQEGRLLAVSATTAVTAFGFLRPSEEWMGARVGSKLQSNFSTSVLSDFEIRPDHFAGGPQRPAGPSRPLRPARRIGEDSAKTKSQRSGSALDPQCGSRSRKAQRQRFHLDAMGLYHPAERGNELGFLGPEFLKARSQTEHHGRLMRWRRQERGDNAAARGDRTF
jgi:hypothetical protein